MCPFFLDNPQPPPSRRSQIVVVNASGQPIGDPKDDEGKVTYIKFF